MLAKEHRVHRTREFTQITKFGQRSRVRDLICYAQPAKQQVSRCGFIVSKSVGNAVIRHRVQRQLRALMRERLPQLHPSLLLVIRVLPGAASRSFSQLGRQLDEALLRYPQLEQS